MDQVDEHSENDVKSYKHLLEANHPSVTLDNNSDIRLQ